MADGLYVGMAAAAARAAQLEAVADNLANAETPGFRAVRPAFQSFLSGRGQTDKVTAAAVGTGVDMRQGTINATDNPMDVVPDDGLFLGVRLASGDVAYTRNGHIEMGPNGELMVAGHPVLGAGGGPLTVPVGAQPTISERGDVTVDGNVVDQLALFQVQGPVERNGLALLTPGPGTAVDQVEGTVSVGQLELGNVGSLESAVAMITAQRNFESAMQAIETYKKMDERATETGRVR